jgi:SOS-response transcriptional repressor LexA
MTKPPTKREYEVLSFIEQYRHRHGYSPMLQEIGAALGMNNPTAHHHIRRLCEKGWLRRSRGKRDLTIVAPTPIAFAPLPVLGEISSAGISLYGRPDSAS